MPEDRLLMPMLTGVALVLLTASVVDVPVYDPLTAPYWNHAVVDVPFAFTVPLSVAEFVVTPVADPVVTVGGNAVNTL